MKEKVSTSPVSHLSDEPVFSCVFCTDGEEMGGNTKGIWLERGEVVGGRNGQNTGSRIQPHRTRTRVSVGGYLVC